MVRDRRHSCPRVCRRGQLDCWQRLKPGSISTALVSRLISARDDVVTQTGRRPHGGAGAQDLKRRKTRETPAENSFRCIGRRRSGFRRPRRSEFGCSLGRCEFAGCDVQVRSISRSWRSSRVVRHADRQPRCRRCHVGPRPRLLNSPSSGLLAFSTPLPVCLPATPRHRCPRLRGRPHVRLPHHPNPHM